MSCAVNWKIGDAVSTETIVIVFYSHSLFDESLKKFHELPIYRTVIDVPEYPQKNVINKDFLVLLWNATIIEFDY